MKSNEWYKNVVFYELHPRSFYDSNDDGIGDLQGITQKLDYIKYLGVDCLWLLPIYPSPLKDGGYDIADFYGIHPELGTLDDFTELVHETHKRSMRIILDLVMNHTSDQCAWFKEAESDDHSPYHDYYVWSDTNNKYKDARIIFIDTEESNWTWSEKAQKFYWHRFYSYQPDLNYSNPAVRDEMKNIMRFWLDMGIDGFRADAVPYLIEIESTNCENLPQTHEYLKEIRKLMDKEYPNCILLAEANQWPRDLIPYFSNGDEFHMAFHFPIMPRIFKSIALGDCEPIIQTLSENPLIPNGCQWCTFLRNHDELTLEMVTEEDRQFLWDFYAPEKRMRLNLGIRRRLSPLMEGNTKKIELLYALLFALPGAPIVYYGDEIGMGDNVWLNDRDGVRTPMQWSDDPNAGFSKGDSSMLYIPIIDSDPYSYHQINVERQKKESGSLLNHLRNLIMVRKNHPVFSSQDYMFFNESNRSVFSIIRSNNSETILCLHNLSNVTQSIPLGRKKYQYLHSSSDLADKQTTFEDDVTLEPYSYLWMVEI